MALKKERYLFFLLIALSFTIQLRGQTNPIANEQAIVTSGNMRFSILTPEIIRIEWSDTQQFEDRASFVVVNRNLPVPQYTSEIKNGYLFIKTDKLELKYKTGSYPLTNPASGDNLSISFDMNGSATIWYPGKKDPLNLKGTSRTLDHSNGDNLRGAMEEGLLSRSGWVLIDEAKPNGDTSKSLLLEKKNGQFDWVSERSDDNLIDWYFMGYGHDYKKALADYTKIAGKMPMPPLYSFGYWYSKYERYSEGDFKNIVNDIHQNDIPLDVMVVDMDWHYAGHPDDGGRGGWTGWTWNKSLFPDPQGFLDWLHDQNLKVTLNLHPADGIAPDEENFGSLADDLNLPKNQTIRWNIENESFYQAFFKNIIRPHENRGVDFWWLDWQQWLLTPGVKDLGNTFWLNHVFYNDMKVNRPDRRPMIFHRWGGLGNHRYQIGFSGDTYPNFPTLAFQIYYNSTASNVAYGYWSHDLGGHNQSGENNPELYLRWIQFGIFSPITRTHATNAPNIERRIWKYPNFKLMKEAVKFRYAMIPYIYTYSREAYDTGLSLCRPLYYDSPEENEAYKQETSYMFGNEIMVSPVVEASDYTIGTASKHFWLPEGKWIEGETGAILEGNQKYYRSYAQDEIPFFYKEGAVIPMYPDIKHLKERSDTLIIQFIPGENGSFSLYEDDGDNQEYQQGEYTTTLITQQTNSSQGSYVINPREGAFTGMPEARYYQLKLLSKLPAQKVTVNGKQYPYSQQPKEGCWSYDSKLLAITIHTPSISCNSQIDIKVDFNQQQATIVDLIAGKQGQIKRLIQCNDSLQSKLGDKMPEVFGMLAATHQRIAENPDKTLDELHWIDENIEAAFDLLLETDNAPVKEINEWKEFILNSYNKENTSDYGGTEPNEEIGYNTDGSSLWITGSAIPGQTAILTEDPTQNAGFFRYHGELLTGEFKIMNTPTVQPDTKYYIPAEQDANAVGSYSMIQTNDKNAKGWNVTIPDKYYKIKVNTRASTLISEIFSARADLFIVGGATEVGWDSGRAIRLKKDLNNPNLFIFSGILQYAVTGDDRNQFKFLGQNDWGPVSFHPATQQETLLESKYLFQNLASDHKWAIDPAKQGHYVIKVDLFQETISAEFTDSYLYSVYIDGNKWTQLDDSYLLDCDTDNSVNIEIIPINNQEVTMETSFEYIPQNAGLNTLDFSIYAPTGNNTKSYRLKLSKPFAFNDIITQMWNNTLTVNNNPSNNGGYKFVDFEWYENNKHIGENKQYYSAGRNSTDLLKSESVYLVKLVDSNGDKFQTCPSQVELEEMTSPLIYPNPAKIGQTININLESGLQEDIRFEVTSINGSLLYSKDLADNFSTIKINHSGAYFIHFISKDGVHSTKLIVE